MFKRVTKFAAPALLTLGLIAGGATAAQASTGQGNQFRAYNAENSPYMDAWDGAGGYVKDYDSAAVNNDFEHTSGGQFAFTPGNCNFGANNCEVLSDYGNDPNNAEAGTYTNLNGAPWGSYFTVTACSINGAGGWKIYDNHWQGYVAPSGNGSTGTQIYLNSASAWCWISYAPA